MSPPILFCVPRHPSTLLCVLLVLGSLVVSPTHAQSPSTAPTPSTEDTTLRDTVVQSAEDAPVQRPTTSEENASMGEAAVETTLEILILGPIILLLLGLLLAFPTVLLAVSLVMDGGCLRYILFGIGWLCAIFYGLLMGLIVGEGIGIGFLVKPIIYAFMWGYPVAAYWGHKKFEAMPDEQYQAWDQTLTGGALLGFGAGSIAGLVRSAASGFGGYGGGSFGGGGASGSWSGASGTATASTTAGSASSTAAGTTASAAGGSTQAAAVASGAAPGVASEVSSGAPASESRARRLWSRVKRWFQKFQWYHGLVFVLVTLVFVPLGLGTMKALQNTKFFVFTLVCVVLYSGYKLFRRYPDAPQSVVSTISSFRGGEASSSWS